MASVTAVTATPDTIAPRGGKANLKPTISNPAIAFTGTVFDPEGGSRSVSIQVGAEDLTFSTDPAKQGAPGFIVCVLSPNAPATVAVAADGVSFDVTAT